MASFDPGQFVGKYGEPPAGGASGEFDPSAFVAKHGGERTPPTLQEMHPAFTAADRLVVKNFANGNDEGADYLQRQHPELEVKVDDGQIKARRRDKSDGGQYRVLDPKSGFVGTLTDPKELALTLGGAGYDLASGLGTTAAAALGGLAGAPAGGVGALPAAAAAGGAAGAGFEGLREGLGKLLGIKQDFQPGQIALSGAGGAVAPLLFGTGATAGQIGAKAIESGLAPEAVAASQRGLLGRALGLASPALGTAGAKLGAAASGVPEGALKTYAANPATIRAMEASPTAVTDFAEKAATELRSRLAALGPNSPLYEKAIDLAEPKKLFGVLKGADSPSNIMDKELLQTLDTTLGTSLMDKASTLQTFMAMQKANATHRGAMAALGGTAGGAIGYHEGGTPGAAAGAAAGAGLGGLLGGPAAIRHYIDAARRLSGAAGALPNATMPAAVTSAWNTMGGAQ